MRVCLFNAPWRCLTRGKAGLLTLWRGNAALVYAF